MKIAYVVSDLRRVGPTNQTLNIIKNSDYRKESIVITLFKEGKSSVISEFEKNKIKVICLNLNRTTFFVSGSSLLIKILIDNKIDLVHSYGIKPDSLCEKVCRKINIPHIITLRNYPKEDIAMRMNVFKRTIALRAHLKVLRNARYVVACSNTIAKKMKNDYPEMQITAIHNGVDTMKYNNCDTDAVEIKKRLGLSLDKRYIISTSSFTKRKRIEESILGFLGMNNPKYVLLLLGSGKDYKPLKSKYGNYNNIVFLENVVNVRDYLNAADIFVSSSESEGLPNGVIEAIACKIPVVLSDIPQHLEVLNEVPNSGMVYHLGDIEDLTKHLNSSTKFDNSGSDIGSSNLTMTKMGKAYSLYYRKVING